jgi:hypothetical protein
MPDFLFCCFIEVRGHVMEGNGRAALFAAVFAALSGFLFLVSSQSLVCVLYEADRLDQREGEGKGEGEGEGDADREA